MFTLIYNLIIWIKYKTIPVSLSETAYIFGGNKKYFFTLYCVILVSILLPALLTVIPESLTIIPFIMCSGLLFAGVSPMFKEGSDKMVHYISAFISFGAFIAFMITCLNWWYFIGYIIGLGILILLKRECYVYFAEMLALIEIIIYLI